MHPDDAESAGRRRFKRAGLSLPKGLAKTEWAALIAICEASPSAPVRTLFEDGVPIFDGQGNPVGTSVTYPYIPMVATTEEQTEDQAYAVVKNILENSGIAHEFDIGLERVMRLLDGGKIQPLAGSPNARDGALTTFQHFDETHRLNQPRSKKAHTTMLNNVPKRYAADAWTLETTTAFEPGEDSIAEDLHTWARKVEEGAERPDHTIFYFHRQASDHHDIKTRDGRRAAVLEASGPSGKFRDIEYVVDLYDSPKTDKAYYERVWLNRPVQVGRRAFDLDEFRLLAKPDLEIPQGALVVAAFDGSQFDDSTSLEVRDVRTGHSKLIGLWERPSGVEQWQVPKEEVDAKVAEIFEYYTVWRMYCDPAHWQDTIASWAGRYGSDRIIEWWTNRIKAMVYAVKGYVEAIRGGTISYDGDPRIERHIGAACKVPTHFRDEKDQPLWYIAKERPDSPFKMDAAMTEVLTNEARNDAIAAGALKDAGPSVYEERDLVLL